MIYVFGEKPGSQAPSGSDLDRAPSLIYAVIYTTRFLHNCKSEQNLSPPKVQSETDSLVCRNPCGVINLPDLFRVLISQPKPTPVPTQRGLLYGLSARTQERELG